MLEGPAAAASAAGAAAVPLLLGAPSSGSAERIPLCCSPVERPELEPRPRKQGCCSGAGVAGAAGGSPSPPADGAVIGTCRICLEQETADSADPANPLICPCLCSGGSKYVHRQCLATWRSKSHRSDAFWTCEVCKYRYRWRRLWWAHLLGSQGALVLLFCTALAGLVCLLGFVPLVNGAFRAAAAGGGAQQPGGPSEPGAQPSPYILHLLNGIIMMGLLGLLLALMLAVGRAFGLPALALLPDPWCPGCVLCWDLQGNGLGWAPLLECGSSGECGVAALFVLAVVVVLVGVVLSAYLLYGLLWLAVQAGLSRAQTMVENVHGPPPVKGAAKV